MDLKLIMKGFVVGIGKVMPGVSGAMLAMTFGVYERVIEAVTDFFGNVREHSKLLLNFGFGLFLAIVFFSRVILFFLNNFGRETRCLFLGLIIGTLIPFGKSLKITKKNAILFFGACLLMHFLMLGYQSNDFIFKGSLLHYGYVFILGVIDAFTSIVPGISGTAIFMLLGSYNFVLSILSQPFSLIFIVFGSGLVLGVVGVCCLMKYLLSNYRSETYSLIMAFMVSSIFVLVGDVFSAFRWYLGIILLLGAILGYILQK